jgi:hypothetical protein
MPDGTNNIYLDSTFTSVDEGYTAVDSSIEFVDPAGNIGNYNIPVIYQTTTSAIAVIDFDVEYLANYITVSGTDNVLSSFFRELSSDFGVVPSLVEYSVDNVISGTLDKNIAYFTGYNVVSGTMDEKVTFIAGEHYTSFKNYLVEHNCGSVISGSNDYWLAYMNYSGHVDMEGLPISALDGQKDLTTEYNISALNIGGLNPYVDVTFAGWVDFIFSTDIFAVDMNVSSPYPFDVETISGGVLPNYLDVYSAELTTSGIEFDVYCSLMSMGIVDTDIELASGRIAYIRGEIYSTAINIPTISCDIDLYSLKITNFSLDIGEYTTASGYISVDVLDDVYGITTSGTYFKVDNEIVSVTFSGIENGYRMFYDPEDDFSSLNGPTIFTARAENNNGDVLEKDYYLTFGYLVEYENHPRIGMNYDYNTKVTVRVTAENYASCPKLSSDGHRFITEQRKNVDLGASIVGMFHADDVSDLSAEIYPESTAYFYGKTFEVVIEAKDFAGNIMPNFILTYKIEDKPN